MLQKNPKWQTLNTIKQINGNSQIPDAPNTWGDLRNSERYKNALQTLKDNPQVKQVVGHSLGGAVALELQKQYPDLNSRVYGAPVFDPSGVERLWKDNVERYRNWNDPVAMFDNSAHITSQGANDNKGVSGFFHHNYDSIASMFKSGNPEMTINLDGS